MIPWIKALLMRETTLVVRVWQWCCVIIALALAILMAGCNSVPWRDGPPPKTQTQGGEMTIEKNSKGDFRVSVSQPSNPDESAVVEVTMPSGEVIRAGTGSSREDEFAGLGLKLDQYKTFTYVGAGVCVLGIGLTVASFWFPLIPKLAGPMVFAGGALTAYMSTAIPDYGPYFLIISLLGAVAWFYHQSAAKKPPELFTRKKPAQ